MIFLTYLYELPNSTSGLDEITTQTITAVPSFAPLLFLFVFFFVFLGGIARQKLASGTADYSMWAVVASMSTLLVALIMSLKTGFIRLDWLSIVLTITIFSGVWFFLEKKSSEV